MRRRQTWLALGAYVMLAVAATWPLAAGLARDVAWDLGDSLLNMWIIAWDCEQLLAILGGDLSRIPRFFDANVFYPAPLTLAYSEHLFAQAVQVLPVYAVTGNPILCYNLLFLSTIVLSGLGTFLLVRELTGSATAAFIAGLLFAFAPYRLGQGPHLQVLSAQWMPFALYGVRRYFDTRRLRTLLWAAVALAVQNLSCGYYLLFFAPVAGGYAVWELAARRLWSDRIILRDLMLAGALAAALTAPFLLPYAEVHERFEMARSRTEVTRLSADVHSYGTAWPQQPLWGGVLQSYPKPEGELFPGVVAVLLALVGIVFRLKPEATSAELTPEATSAQLTPEATNARLRPEAAHGGAGKASDAEHRWRVIPSGGFRLQAEGPGRALAIALAGLAMLHVVLAGITIVERRVNVDLGLFALRMSDVNQLLLRAAVAFALLLSISPAARRRAAAFLRDRGFFVIALIAAAWLSLGPAPQSGGRLLDLIGPYAWLYDYVPGFDGVRVPARFGMIVALMLAILGGLGAAVLTRWKAGAAAAAAMAAVFLLEGTVVPFVVNGMTPPAGYAAPSDRVYRPARAPRLYREAARLVGDGVLAELPLGQPDYDLRAMYYSTVHWRKILNGYSGFYPPFYGQLAAALTSIPRRPDLAILALEGAGVTHVLVHEGAYLGNEGEQTSDALRTRGAFELDRDGSDVLFALPR